MMNKTLVLFLTCNLLLNPLSWAEQEHGPDGHQRSADDSAEQHQEGATDESSGNEEDGEEAVTLTSTQMTLANITVAALNPRPMNYTVYTPGEVVANGYTTYLVSPRVDSVVLQRHAALGDHVEQGQPLVTLFSEMVAAAQGEFRVSAAEWARVQKLGRKTVGDRRFIAARADVDADRGRLQAYGLSDAAIDSLTAPDSSFPLGEYALNAATSGAVLSDEFQQGQRVTAGTSLMLLADESALWVEARLAPNMQLLLPAGTRASVKVGNDLFNAEVTQQAHTIDPQTRTRVVRLLVQNPGHRLHPGMFADVLFTFSTETPVLAVPEEALIRSADGDWTVFIEDHPGEFKAQEVSLGRSLGEWREISGIDVGTRVVNVGAFFVASQIAKGGFDPHGH